MDRKIILPGEKIADKPLHINNAYVNDGKTYATVIGLCDEDGRYTALEGVYEAKPEDTLVGLVVDAMHWGYSLDLNLPARGALSSKDTRLRLSPGDVIVGSVKFVKNTGEVELTNVKKLPKGKIIQVSTSKVPRIIGKKSSMLNMIRKSTESDVVVGNNGYIWADEKGNISLLTKVFDTIVKNAHKKGLTDRMSEFIEKNKQVNNND